jgi:hypothetical protein
MWQRWLILSLVVMSVANTISRERVFATLRARLGNKDTWLGYLVSCPYCLSHWISFVLVPLFGLHLAAIPYDWPVATPVIDWFFNSILVVQGAAFLRMIFFSIDDLVGVFRRFERLEDDEIERRQGELRSGPALGSPPTTDDRRPTSEPH